MVEATGTKEPRTEPPISQALPITGHSTGRVASDLNAFRACRQDVPWHGYSDRRRIECDLTWWVLDNASRVDPLKHSETSGGDGAPVAAANGTQAPKA